jgi:uncharacterized integral membrane protein
MPAGEDTQMRENIQDDPLRKRLKTGPSRAFSYWLARVRATSKLALGVLLVALLALFAFQNSDVIEVRFLVWRGDMSQALVVLLALCQARSSGPC